ncbi:MAG: short-chain fatty acyl-CoA regulator family protein [Pseudomonadota bacterium]
MRKLFMGARLRTLREQRQLTQAALAEQLGISASYLNQIENNERPLSSQVVWRMQSRLGIDPEFFSGEEEARLLAQLRDVTTDLAVDVPKAEVQAFVQQMPNLAELVTRLHGRYRSTEEQNMNLLSRNENRDYGVGFAQPHEEVRDFFYARHNYVEELDLHAEALHERLLGGGRTSQPSHKQSSGQHRAPGASELVPALVAYLQERYGVQVQIQRAEGHDGPREYNPQTKVLRIDASIEPGQQAFQIANQLAHLEVSRQIAGIVKQGNFSGEAARQLTVIGLASYFAGALLLPYARFLASAERLKYDIDLLSREFGVSYETICHRLSTLQRQEARGVPFFFVRVDRAGNVSKRQSATDFHFSRAGGTCPLWAVYEAFSRPGHTLTQMAVMPDGRTSLWIARCVTHRQGGFGTPERTFAIGLGCDLRHAQRLVYAQGINLEDLQVAVPIGPGCKVCKRNDCRQRAFPALDQSLRIDQNKRQWEPYPMESGV